MKKTNKGFTLVELIIVIAILAIIMLIAIPNFSGIQQRMKVRADKATAAQIGKAVRVWHTDFTTDKTLKNSLNADKSDGLNFLEGKMVDYSTELKSIDTYCSKYVPTSLAPSGTVVKHQRYVVGLTDDTATARICVGIQNGGNEETANWTATPLAVGSEVNYDGTAQGIAYVEPGTTASPAPDPDPDPAG